MRIIGHATGRTVSIDGLLVHPRQSQRVMNHSPDGFEWGYGGSGPAQLALAILLTAGVGALEAVTLHQDFKRAVIAPLAQGRDFQVEVDVEAWLAAERTRRLAF